MKPDIMKKILIVISFIFSQLLIAQESDSIQSIIDSIWVQRKGYIKDYYEINYFKNSNIKSKGYSIIMKESPQFDLIYKFGKWEYFYKNGGPYKIEYYDLKGNLCDTTKKYLPNGQLFEEIIWDDDITYQIERNKEYRLVKGYCLKKYRYEKLQSIKYLKSVKGKLVKSGEWIWYNKDGSVKRQRFYEINEKTK